MSTFKGTGQTEAEWAEAEAFFNSKSNSGEVKFHNKKDKAFILSASNEIEKKESTGRDFVKIAEVIYALNNTSNIVHEPDAGLGGFGRVKRAIDRKGKMVVVKVEGKESKKKYSRS